MCGHNAYDWNTMPIRRRSGGMWRPVLDTTVSPMTMRPRIQFVEAGDLAQQRGLAASRGPENGHELAVADFEGDVVEGAKGAERLGHAIDGQPRHGRTPCASLPDARSVDAMSTIVTMTVSTASAEA